MLLSRLSFEINDRCDVMRRLFSSSCFCSLDGKQLFLLRLIKKKNKIKSINVQAKKIKILALTIGTLLIVVALLIIDRSCHCFRFFFWHNSINWIILVSSALNLLLFSTSISPSSVFTFFVFLLLFLIIFPIMSYLYSPILLHLALTLNLVDLLARLLVLRIFCFSDEFCWLFRIRLDWLKIVDDSVTVHLFLTEYLFFW